MIASTWPDEPRPVGVAYPDPSRMPLVGESPILSDVLSDVGNNIRRLQPTDAFHGTGWPRAMQTTATF